MLTETGKSYSAEMLLQFFVCIIDAELLKAVDVESFETVDIQNSYEMFLSAVHIVPSYGVVCSRDHVVEQTRI